MLSSSDYRVEAERFLKELNYGAREPLGLFEPAGYILDGGGKRLRPLLTLMACEAFGGRLDDALAPAAGLEVFHNFTLVHDDIMDNSPLRRSRPTVHAKWNVNTAILSGDAMLTLATQLVAQVDDVHLREVLEIFNAMALDVYSGQQLDMDFERRSDLTQEQYLNMIRLKTGALLGACARIGAIVGGATPVQAARMEEFGRCLGVAFQIRDDYLDVFGNESELGKPIGGDILNDKTTFLKVSALDASETDRQALDVAMSLQGEAKIKAVTSIYARIGLEQECKKAISHWTGRALRELKKARLDDEGREAFTRLAEKLTGRSK